MNVTWQTPRPFPVLDAGAVHLWRADLDALSTTAAWHELLDIDEGGRAARFRRDVDRTRFTATRGVLRTLLGRYLNIEPRQITFAYNAAGKPELAPRAGETLHFNISHSRHVALLAFTKTSPLGVDVEYLRDDWSDERLKKLATRFFHPRECEALVALAGGERRALFFRLWTQKEALVKARGEKLWNTISEEIESAAALGRWSLRTFSPALGFQGALATHGPEQVLRTYEFTVESLSR